jgi:hypothetical protein
MSRNLTKDGADFYEAAKAAHPLLGRYVLSKLNDGRDPRDIVVLLVYETEQLRCWCTGRFGQ